MSEEHKKSHSAIRTFAQDLAQAREKRGQPTTDSSLSAPTEKLPVKKVPPKDNFTAQAPQETKRATHITVTPKKTDLTATTSANISLSTKPSADHNLQETMDKVTKKSAVKSSKNKSAKNTPKISTKPAATSRRTNIGYDTAIITDNKHKRFSLTRAIGESLTNWFKNFRFSKKKTSPVYTVPDTQRRKGVIQKATSKSGSVFTADSSELKAKIKQRQKLAAARKEAESAEGELSWSPYTDTGFALLESPEVPAAKPQNVTVEFKQLSHPEKTPPLPIEPVVAIPAEPLAAPEPLPEPAPETDFANSRWATPPPPEPVSPPAQPAAAAAPIAPTEVETVPTTQPTRVDDSEKSARSGITSINTNTLAMSIVAGLSIAVVVFFVGQAIFAYVTNVEPVSNRDTTSYLVAATANPVVVSQLNSITDIPLQAGKLLDIDYVDTQLFTPNGEIIPPANLVAALNFTMQPSFTQSLTDLRFAQKSQSKPIIILEFSDHETALGGFLNWEASMAQDLRELYLITQTGNSEFIDMNIAGADVRVLQSVSGETLAVYGIVSTDTAIITGSLDTFIQVVNTSFKK